MSDYEGGVTLDTRVETEDKRILTMEQLFKEIGYTLSDMETGKLYNVFKNIKLLSYNHDMKMDTFKKIQGIVYRGNFEVWEVRSGFDWVYVKGKNDHKIFDIDLNDYVCISKIEKGRALHKIGNFERYSTVNTKKIEPIVDIQIDGGNYFSNTILSHNNMP